MSGRRFRKLAFAAGFCAVGASLAGAPAVWAAAGDDATVVSEDFAVGAQDGAAHSVDCGPQRRAIGGGVLAAADGYSFPVSTGPLDQDQTVTGLQSGDVPRYWYSAVANHDPVNGRTYTAYAVCSANSDATVQVNNFAVNGGGGSGDGAAACPTGQRAVGGGVLSPAGSELSPVRSLLANGPLDETGQTQNTDNGDIAKFWYAAAFSGDSMVTEKAVAVCSPGSTASLQMAPFSLPKPGYSTVPATCPAGSRAISGGMVGEGTIETEIYSTAPIAGGWSTTATYLGSGSSTPVRFSAICQPEPLTAGGPTGKRAAALKKCKRKHSRKTRKRCRRRALKLPL